MKKIIIFLFALIVGIFLFGWYEVTNSKVSERSFIAKLIPENTKEFLKKNIFYIPTLIKNYEVLSINYEKNKHDFNEKYLKNIYLWKKLSSLIQNDYFIIKKNESFLKTEALDNFEINTKQLSEPIIYKDLNFEYTLDNFNLPFLERNSWKKPTAFIEKYKNHLWIVTGDGILLKVKINELFLKEAKFELVKSNFTELNLDSLFYDGGGHSIKDLYIDKDKIYLSYTKEIKNNCYNTSIIAANLNRDTLHFEDFFTFSECQSINNSEYVAIQSGGRIEKFNDDNIIFSIGEYRNRKLAQNDESLFGKIILININTKTHKIFSKGHRNTQGLYFDNENNTLISTEHGPKGGDEINIHKKINENLINNYGWPISSYGEHYDGEERIEAPLYKSHNKYGFIEPIKYYVPSIAISDIEKVNFDSSYKNYNQYIIASLGSNVDANQMSLHYLVFNKNYDEIIKEDIIPIGERIRDIVNLDQNNFILMLENSPSIGLLKINSLD